MRHLYFAFGLTRLIPREVEGRCRSPGLEGEIGSKLCPGEFMRESLALVGRHSRGLVSAELRFVSSVVTIGKEQMIQFLLSSVSLFTK